MVNKLLFFDKNIIQKRRFHWYHLVDASPWPLFSAIAIFLFTTSTILWLQGYIVGKSLFIFSFIYILISMVGWWRDIAGEAIFGGHHTSKVATSHQLGFYLFIVSEVMFFVGFFWAYFHSSLHPTIQIGSVWPPVGQALINFLVYHGMDFNFLALLVNSNNFFFDPELFLAKNSLSSSKVRLTDFFTFYRIEQHQTTMRYPFYIPTGGERLWSTETASLWQFLTVIHDLPTNLQKLFVKAIEPKGFDISGTIEYKGFGTVIPPKRTLDVFNSTGIYPYSINLQVMEMHNTFEGDIHSNILRRIHNLDASILLKYDLSSVITCAEDLRIPIHNLFNGPVNALDPLNSRDVKELFNLRYAEDLVQLVDQSNFPFDELLFRTSSASESTDWSKNFQTFISILDYKFFQPNHNFFFNLKQSLLLWIKEFYAPVIDVRNQLAFSYDDEPYFITHTAFISVQRWDVHQLLLEPFLPFFDYLKMYVDVGFINFWPLNHIDYAINFPGKLLGNFVSFLNFKDIWLLSPETLFYFPVFRFISKLFTGVGVWDHTKNISPNSWLAKQFSLPWSPEAPWFSLTPYEIPPYINKVEEGSKFIKEINHFKQKEFLGKIAEWDLIPPRARTDLKKAANLLKWDYLGYQEEQVYGFWREFYGIFFDFPREIVARKWVTNYDMLTLKVKESMVDFYERNFLVFFQEEGPLFSGLLISYYGFCSLLNFNIFASLFSSTFIEPLFDFLETLMYGVYDFLKFLINFFLRSFIPVVYYDFLKPLIYAGIDFLGFLIPGVSYFLENIILKGLNKLSYWFFNAPEHSSSWVFYFLNNSILVVSYSYQTIIPEILKGLNVIPDFLFFLEFIIIPAIFAFLDHLFYGVFYSSLEMLLPGSVDFLESQKDVDAAAYENLPSTTFGLPSINTILLLASSVILVNAHVSFKIQRVFKPMVFKKLLNKVPVCQKDGSLNYKRKLKTKMISSKTLNAQNVNKRLKFFDYVIAKKFLPYFIRVVKPRIVFDLFWSICLGLIFTILQLYEYNHAPFALKDGIYASLFFLTTGFHGIHVFIGAVFLFVSLLRLLFDYLNPEHHQGFTFAEIYWHFVDAVWLFVFFIFYLYIYTTKVPLLEIVQDSLGERMLTVGVLDKAEQLSNKLALVNFTAMSISEVKSDVMAAQNEQLATPGSVGPFIQIPESWGYKDLAPNINAGIAHMKAPDKFPVAIPYPDETIFTRVGLDDRRRRILKELFEFLLKNKGALEEIKKIYPIDAEYITVLDLDRLYESYLKVIDESQDQLKRIFQLWVNLTEGSILENLTPYVEKTKLAAFLTIQEDYKESVSTEALYDWAKEAGQNVWKERMEVIRQHMISVALLSRRTWEFSVLLDKIVLSTEDPKLSKAFDAYLVKIGCSRKEAENIIKTAQIVGANDYVLASDMFVIAECTRAYCTQVLCDIVQKTVDSQQSQS